ncbi:MAG: ribonuclease E/G [Bacteroidetes bacterium]|nr:MAG: ribonuclease E/G [Bacteroidota bacterium]REK04998.1 MAG: ribonuclease E/G [Bacteroidota bacterium]REK36498.1 MAG: ribonuclease E/G [Bacteroidota bacterium]REK51712.1 MAG: ribonuclease E/G [Bacteroidota bacterium]
MNNELVINSTPGEVQIALLEEKRLVELNSEKKDQGYQVGDIYLGRVKKLIPGLNAAFVDVGHEKDAFLHYLDLGPQVQSLLKLIKLTTTGKNPDPLLNGFQLEADINKGGKINQVLTSNQWVLVQVAKEPISSKGPRVTSELSLAGRFVVLVPFSDTVSISQKIKSSEERQRLKRLAMSIKPKGFGVIVRTVAEGKKTAELDKDIQDLVAKWKGAFQLLQTAKPPYKILGELNRTSTILRDLLNPNFNAIHVNETVLFEEIKSYISGIAPEQTDIVKLYKGRLPIFEQFGIDKQIKITFGKTVTMANGAYLIIEHTEAMHVIDVNSGGRTKSDGDASQEINALNVNLDAAAEIARQLRLRDMGGIIVVDFIDLNNAANRKTLFEKLRTEMKKDRAKHTILPPSKFGLVQITRQRVRPETNITTVEKCPACEGTGEIKASVLLIDEIENNLRYFVQEQNEKELVLIVHPFIEAYLNKGLFLNSMAHKWKKKYKFKLKVLANNNYHFMEYHFFNKQEEEIKI